MKVKLYLSTNLQYYLGNVNYGYGLWCKFGCALIYLKIKMYIFGSASSFVIIVFASNCALWCDPFMLCLNMSVESWIRQIWLVACPTSKLSAFFITSCFSSFLLFYLWCLGVPRIIFYVKVVDHIHCLHGTIIYHFRFTIIVLLSYWEKLCVIFLLNNIGLIFRA